MELAEEVARLADVGQQVLERAERSERDRRSDELLERWGHRAPPRLGLPPLLAAVPGLAARFDRIVPPEMTVQTGPGEVSIACPCGQTPTCSPGHLSSCECERWFLHDGTDIHVARFDTSERRTEEP